MSHQISMAELNKKANAIINQVAETGEAVTIVKHGQPVAEIIPINDNKVVEDALDYFLSTPPIKVDVSIDSIIKEGRERGL